LSYRPQVATTSRHLASSQTKRPASHRHGSAILRDTALFLKVPPRISPIWYAAFCCVDATTGLLVASVSLIEARSSLSVTTLAGTSARSNSVAIVSAVNNECYCTAGGLARQPPGPNGYGRSTSRSLGGPGYVAPRAVFLLHRCGACCQPSGLRTVEGREADAQAGRLAAASHQGSGCGILPWWPCLAKVRPPGP